MRYLLLFAFTLFAADPAVNLLEQSSLAFTQIADKAMPATVFIKAQVVQQEMEMPGDELFRRFFGNPPTQQTPQLAGGSGFLISEDGYIVTNHHVVKDATQITVILNDEREYTATVKSADPRTDVALLKIEEKGLPFLTFGNSDALKVGEWVVAIGNPFGLEATLTVGVVSAKGRQDVGISSYEDFIQTDAAINPGNSGGPLLNLRGEVVGINTAIFSRSGGYMGIGFAIPSSMASHVVDQLKNGGNVKRAYLGVVLQPVDKDLADALTLDKQEGIVISEVTKDSPAAKAKLENGDIILQYNGKSAKSISKFRNDIAMMTPGTSLQLKILRNNKPIHVTAILGSQSEGEVISGELLQKMGLQVENLTPDMMSKLGVPSDTEGVAITKIKPNSPAANAGLRPSFVIIGIASNLHNQKRVRNVADLEEALQEIKDRKHIILIVRHQTHQRYYTVKLG
jgi:serine protease Do